MEYRILGSIEVLDPSGRKLPLGGAMRQSVLASLLLRVGQTVVLDRLVDELWDEPPATAARTVQAYVSRCATSCRSGPSRAARARSEEHTSELQSRGHLVCRLLLEKKKNTINNLNHQKKKKKK